MGGVGRLNKRGGDPARCGPSLQMLLLGGGTAEQTGDPASCGPPLLTLLLSFLEAPSDSHTMCGRQELHCELLCYRLVFILTYHLTYNRYCCYLRCPYLPLIEESAETSVRILEVRVFTVNVHNS